MTVATARQSDGTIELTITIPWANIEKTYEEVVNRAVENAEVTGFRKGKAPRNLVEPKLDKTKLYEEALQNIIPDVYNQAVTDAKIKPIINPKIELKEATEKKDWILRILTCERPALSMGDYKKAVSDLKSGNAKKLWVPGKDEKPEEKNKPAKPSLDEVLTAILSVVTVTIPSLLLDHEVNRLLSDLIDQTKKLGLTVDQYLSSTGRTADTVRKEYGEQARRTLTVEFALEDIADKEGILVSDDDIDTVIKSAKTDAERDALKKQRYYIASVLRRQKTLDFLSAL
ncbi:hypothetical protein M1555_02955 [Patescibacteria group bacterium]|nr:hypothetical protein [Patescibacteria group bacterium]